MKGSLQFHLSKMLIVAILLTGSLATLASFYSAYNEAQEFQDDDLRQIAAESVGRLDTAQLDAAEKEVFDPESRITIVRLPGSSRPDWLPARVKKGFHTYSSQDRDYRVFVRDDQNGTNIAVIQLTDIRDEIALDSALRTLVPMLLLMPVLVWLAIRIVHRNLAGIRRLSEDVHRQSAAHLQPLPEMDIPDEVVPFVQAINGMLARVAKMVSEQRRFVADAAHELRSPLTALSLQIQNLESADSIATMHDRAAPLKLGIDRARHLVEQLLSLAATQAASLEEEEVNVSQMARELIADYIPMAEAKHIDLGLNETGTIKIRSSLVPLRLILKNALDNALLYTPRNGEVTVKIRHDDDELTMEVIDNGPGVPEQEIEKIFQPFYRIDESQGDGSGLGLAIAHDAALRLGGSLSLESGTDGHGLLFRYKQPYRH